MSRVLPYELRDLILAYLPLAIFDKYNFKPNAWQMRFFYRYNQLLDTNDVKRKYAIRAATEHHEVATVTPKYYAPTIAYYHAALGGNWDLLNAVTESTSFLMAGSSFRAKLVLGDLTDEIFIQACRQNQLPFVRRTAKYFASELGKDADYVWTRDIYDYLLKYHYRDCWMQLLAFAPLSDFVQLIKLHNLNHHLIGENIILNIGRYYKQNPYHWEDTAAKINALTGKSYNKAKEFYFNLEIKSSLIHEYFDDIICYYNTASMGDWLLTSNISYDDTTSELLRSKYSCFPNAYERATETIRILTKYADQNKTLLPFIHAIKIILNIFTPAEAPLSPLTVDQVLSVILLNNHRFDICDIMLSKIGSFVLHAYDVLDADVLKYILTNNKITGNIYIAKILTLPMIAEIHDLLYVNVVNQWMANRVIEQINLCLL